MTAAARIRLLGPLDVRLGSDEATPGSARAESLVAFLVLHRGISHQRERVASALWPDSSAAQARTNLRHVLHTLRRDIPELDRYVESTGRTLRWRPDAPLWCDVAEYERLLAVTDPADRVAALREAVTLYGGELAEGRDEGWVGAERDRLAARQLDALDELARLCEDAGDIAEATGHTERLLRLNPLREPTHRTLMRLHDAAGDRARALRAYHLCASTLERELGVEPSGPTRAAYAALLAGPTPAPAPRAGRSALVGRAVERAALASAWQAATSGAARLVLVGGEPGIGKTRLVEELRTWCTRRQATVAAARCYPAEGPLAYGPVADWLRSPPIRARLPRLGQARLAELAQLLPELSAPVTGPGAAVPAPDTDRRRLFDAVTAALVAPAGATLLVVDDIPYVDRETCRLLHYLLRVAAEARLLVVATARAGDVEAAGPLHDLLAGLRRRDRLTEIELDRLGPAETAELAARTTGAPLPGADARRLHAETEGNPLHVVEALRGGWTPGAPLGPRVQSVISDRLALLGDPARDLLAVAAVIGREFPVDVLAAASARPDEEVVRGLDELWRRRIVREQGDGESYDFTHDRIRQVAYLGVTPARRRLLHRRIAAALEDLHASAPGPVSARIAAHREQAGDAGAAIGWYRRAAAAAQLLHADERAVGLLDRALTLSATMPPGPGRDAVELELHTALLGPLVPVHGYASAALHATHRRAADLTERLGAEPAAPLLRSLALDALTRSDFAAATRHGLRLRAAADRGGPGSGVLIVEAAYVLGIAAFWQTDLAAARSEFELAIRRYDPRERLTHLVDYVQDPRVVCQSRLANTLWLLGEPAAALAARDAALGWADQVGHRFSRSTALSFAALLAIDMDDEPGARRFAAELVAQGDETVHDQVAAALRGYVAVLDGDSDRGLAQVRAAVGRIAVTPAAPGQGAVLQRIALAAAAASGRPAEAVAEADRLLAAGGPARLWAPVARRLRAQLTGNG